MGARNRDAAVAASWQQDHRSLFAPRRSAGTAAAARSCGVAAATATMCAAVVTMPLDGNSTIAHCPRCDVKNPASCTFRVVKNSVLSPKTQARAQVGSKVNRAAGRVIKNACLSVTIDGPMMRIPTHRANGRDREESELCEGRYPLCHP